MTPEQKHSQGIEDTIQDAFWKDDALSSKYHSYLVERNIANGLQVSARSAAEWRARTDIHSSEYKARRKKYDKK